MKALFVPFASVLLLLPVTAQDAPAAKPASQSWKGTDAYPLDTVRGSHPQA